jgi:hypothetical protein
LSARGSPGQNLPSKAGFLPLGVVLWQPIYRSGMPYLAKVGKAQRLSELRTECNLPTAFGRQRISIRMYLEISPADLGRCTLLNQGVVGTPLTQFAVEIPHGELLGEAIVEEVAFGILPRQSAQTVAVG